MRKAVFSVLQKSFGTMFQKVFGLPFIGMYLRKKVFLNFFPKRKFNSILDIGCGDGTYSFFLAKKFPDSTVFGIDLLKHSIQSCNGLKSKLGLQNVFFQQADLLNYPKKEKFDLAILIEVLHLVDAKKTLKQISCFLKKKGLLIVIFPAKNWFSGTFLKKFIETKEMERFGGFTDKQLFSEKQISELFSLAGFSIIKKKHFFGFFGSLAWELEFLLVHSRLQRFYYIFYPFVKAIAFFDVFFENKNGRAIIVIAEKEGN